MDIGGWRRIGPRIAIVGLLLALLLSSWGGISAGRAGFSPEYGGSLSASYGIQDITTGSSLSCGATVSQYDDLQFTATVTGGTPSYTYSWSWGDGSSGSGNPATYAYSSTGTVNPTLTVTDSAGNTASSGQGCDLTISGSSGGGGSSGNCPDSYDYGSSSVLDLASVVACAVNAGFSGGQAITFVSMAYQESSFRPGVTGGLAEGILQEGFGCDSPPSGCNSGGPGSSYYNPSSCSTYDTQGTSFGGVYYNPACAFGWAMGEFNYRQANPPSPCPYGGYCFWGSYGGNQWAGYSEAPGLYCKWAPSGFGGYGPVLCDSSTGYPSGGENQANLPWSSVCPSNTCAMASFSMYDTTSHQDLSSGGTIAAGDTVEFHSQVLGLTGNYTPFWTFGDGSSATGSVVNHTFHDTGSLHVVLNVMGGSSGVRVTTAPPTSLAVGTPSSPSGGFPWAYVAVGIAAAVVVVLVVLVLHQKHAKRAAMRESTSAPSSPPDLSPPPPPYL